MEKHFNHIRYYYFYYRRALLRNCVMGATSMAFDLLINEKMYSNMYVKGYPLEAKKNHQRTETRVCTFSGPD